MVRREVERVMDTRSEVLLYNNIFVASSGAFINPATSTPAGMNNFVSVLPQSLPPGVQPFEVLDSSSIPHMTQPQVNLTIEAEFIDIALDIWDEADNSNLGATVRIILLEDTEATGPAPLIGPEPSTVWGGETYLAVNTICSQQALADLGRSPPRLRPLLDQVIQTQSTQHALCFRRRVPLGRKVIEFTPSATGTSPAALLPAKTNYWFQVINGLNNASTAEPFLYSGNIVFGFRNRS
jgi:hypothetical protein